MRLCSSFSTRALRGLVLLAAVAALSAGCGGGGPTNNGPSCKSGTVECAGICVDTGTNLANCGGCGKICKSGETCENGLCLSGCPTGFDSCDGICTDLSTDPQHCGSCENSCGFEGSACADGACNTSCGRLTDCGGSCVDVQTNAANCGGCGFACAQGAECRAGMCSVACPGTACGACKAPVIAPIIPQNIGGSTATSSEHYQPSCGGSATDEIFLFVAPQAGHYIFDTSASDYNTVLAALAPDCTERECNDNDPNGGFQSRIELDLNAREPIYLAIDGFRGATGSFTLHISQPPPQPMCVSANLGSTVPQTKSGSTTGLSNNLDAPCGSDNGPDVAFSFTAPLARQYTFDTIGSNYDTVLYVLNSCTSESALGCNDDIVDFTEQQSRLTLSLAARQTVIIVVDGFNGSSSGSYVLNIK